MGVDELSTTYSSYADVLEMPKFLVTRWNTVRITIELRHNISMFLIML